MKEKGYLVLGHFEVVDQGVEVKDVLGGGAADLGLETAEGHFEEHEVPVVFHFDRGLFGHVEDAGEEVSTLDAGTVTFPCEFLVDHLLGQLEHLGLFGWGSGELFLLYHFVERGSIHMGLLRDGHALYLGPLIHLLFWVSLDVQLDQETLHFVPLGGQSDLFLFFVTHGQLQSLVLQLLHHILQVADLVPLFVGQLLENVQLAQ